MNRPLITEYQKARTILDEEKVVLTERTKETKSDEETELSILDELYRGSTSED